MKKILSIVAALFMFMTYGCQQQKEQRQQTTPLAAPGISPLQVEQLQAATRMSPKSAQAWISLGDALMDSRRFGEAVEAYQKAVKVATERYVAGRAGYFRGTDRGWGRGR